MRRPAAFISILALLATLVATPAFAAERLTYGPGVLQKAEAAGKPIVVHVTAKWCSTCAAQMPIVMKLLKDGKYKDLVLINVDFDKDKSILRKLGVQAQSTFVAFKGKRELARSTGDTDKASIQSLFDKTS